jgi:hypothetical protein
MTFFDSLDDLALFMIIRITIVDIVIMMHFRSDTLFSRPILLLTFMKMVIVLLMALQRGGIDLVIMAKVADLMFPREGAN